MVVLKVEKRAETTAVWRVAWRVVEMVASRDEKSVGEMVAL